MTEHTDQKHLYSLKTDNIMIPHHFQDSCILQWEIVTPKAGEAEW